MLKKYLRHFQQFLENHWYSQPKLWLSCLLLPATFLYSLVIKLRWLLYKIRVLPSYQLTVPVVVIGNLSVGGSGKTPLTKYLAQTLINQGIQVGIILRGYKSQAKIARVVAATDLSYDVGDEALVYAQHNLLVAIGKSRVQAGSLLLQQYPTLQLILSDDGLQHYALHRDWEICVIDGKRISMPHYLLPCGPFREPLSRLKTVNTVIITDNRSEQLYPQLIGRETAAYRQQFNLRYFINPTTGAMADIAMMHNKLPLVALAAIGHPERFFIFLEQLSLPLQQKLIFPDHYHYQYCDLTLTDTLITTEKDYTKLAKFQLTNIWVAVIDVQLIALNQFSSCQLITSLKNLARSPN